MSFLDSLSERARLGEVGRFAPWVQRLLGRGGVLGGAFRLMFRPRLEGWENLPASGAYLIVVNHSGGGGADVAVLASLWAERFGGEHCLAAMAHPLAFHCPGLASLVRGLGAIPSSYDQALKALQAETPVLVFPGGDHEAFRPFWQASRVDFNGRQGFLRLAREAQVAIVPLGLRGASYTNPILWRSKLLSWLLVLPRLLGLKRFPLTLSGVVGAGLLLGLLGPAWSYPAAAALSAVWIALPTTILGPWIPWTVTASIGEPISPNELFPEHPDLGQAHEQVRSAVAHLVRPSASTAAAS